ncbi:MAG: SufS family cysteine desulfurase [Candidatus Peribacteraceae bacterium]|jgi:cysteine desulfurase/selenocysteine lyase
MLDLPAIRRQFPALNQQVNGNPLVYLDNAATTQKPHVVLDAMTHFYERDNANPHRGMHPLAERATEAFEHARATVTRFIHAPRQEEVIFTKNATESINIVARGLAAKWGKGDAIAISLLEHHSNLVPWLMLREEKGFEIRWIDTDPEGHLDLHSLDEILKDGAVRLIPVTALSNVLGNRPPLEAIIERAHGAGALVLVDAAQSIAHHEMNVTTLGCDFLAFSGHKLFGPTGIGILWGRGNLLNKLPPLLGGGMMMEDVCSDSFVAAEIPTRFEGGTPPVAEVVGLGAAIEWFSKYSWKDIEAHEARLLSLVMQELSGVSGLKMYGPQNITERSGSVIFTVDGVHAHDLAHLLGERGICLRAGNHCAKLLHERLGLLATTRLSVALYNTEEEIRTVAPAIRDICKKLRGS